MRRELALTLLLLFTNVVYILIILSQESELDVARDRITELESNGMVCSAMLDMNLGVWCGLAVHYSWLDDEDVASIEAIIESGVYDENRGGVQ